MPLLKYNSLKASVKFKIKQNGTRCDIVIMRIVIIAMHWYGNLSKLWFQQFWYQTKQVSFYDTNIEAINLNFKIKGT